MFQTHSGTPKRLENVPFFFQNPALVALATLWPPGCPQYASGVASPGHLGGSWSPPWSPRASPECPKRVLKIIPNHFLSLVCLWGVPGMPPGSPIDPKRHEKVKQTPKSITTTTLKCAKKNTVAALRAALLDTD